MSNMQKATEHLKARPKTYLSILATILGTIAASGLIDPLSTSGVVLGLAISALTALGVKAYKEKKEVKEE